MDGKCSFFSFLLVLVVCSFFVYFLRPQRWDEWLAFDSPRIAPFRSRTNHNPSSSSLNPTPNIAVAHAPPTGINDVRTILPELANLFRTLQPLVEELSSLSEEVSYVFVFSKSFYAYSFAFLESTL
jgi:hypothetical protein